MKELFGEQEQERYKLRLQHLIERASVGRAGAIAGSPVCSQPRFLPGETGALG